MAGAIRCEKPRGGTNLSPWFVGGVPVGRKPRFFRSPVFEVKIAIFWARYSYSQFSTGVLKTPAVFTEPPPPAVGLEARCPSIFNFGGLKKGGKTPRYRTENGPRCYDRPTTTKGLGFQILLSRSFVGGAFPFISALEVATAHRSPSVLLGHSGALGAPLYSITVPSTYMSVAFIQV
jgi:hypothetical protein